MKRTGVFAYKNEIETLKKQLNLPYLVSNGRPPDHPTQEAHRIALKHGLPEITGYYGCDLITGEFLEV